MSKQKRKKKFEAGEESVLQSKYRGMYMNALDRATNPKSKDYMKFDGNVKVRLSYQLHIKNSNLRLWRVAVAFLMS